MLKRVDTDRRLEKRIYLKYTTAFTVFTNDGLVPFDLVDLIEISNKGLSFVMPKDFKRLFEHGAIIKARLYLGNLWVRDLKYYLPLTVKVINITDTIDRGEQKIRFGCQIIYEEDDYKKVLTNLIKFIDSATQYIKEDKGDYFFPNTIA